MDTCFLNRACAEHVRSMLFGPVASQPFPSCPLCTLCARAVSSRALFTRARHAFSPHPLLRPVCSMESFHTMSQCHPFTPALHSRHLFWPSLHGVSSHHLLARSLHVISSPLHACRLFTWSLSSRCLLKPLCANCVLMPPLHAASKSAQAVASRHLVTLSLHVRLLAASLRSILDSFPSALSPRHLFMPGLSERHGICSRFT